MGEGEGRSYRQKPVEIVTAALFIVLGAIVIYDSVRLGAKWGDDGPQAGYFPFYLGVIVCLSSLINLVQALLIKPEKNGVFVEGEQLKTVLAVLVPAVIYTALIGWIGIYVASTVFIAFFMRWLGKYVWWKVAAVSIGVNAVFFVIFEIWFKVPLPKGPVESMLGLN